MANLYLYVNKEINFNTTNGKSHEIPEPLCRAAIVVGPPNDGIQKNPSVNSPFMSLKIISPKKTT